MLLGAFLFSAGTTPFSSCQALAGIAPPVLYSQSAAMPRSLKQRILFTAALLLIILCTGTIGFCLIDGYPPFDAFYMTLTTITTVGYQEIHGLSRAGRIFNSFLIVFGVSFVFLAVGLMTQTIIELELQDRYGRRRKKQMIAALKNHYI